jgi:hypothetical protein
MHTPLHSNSLIAPNTNDNEFHSLKKIRTRCFGKCYSKTEFCPFIIYADFESYVSPVESSTEPPESSTRVIKLSVNTFLEGFVHIVLQDKAYQTAPYLYSGSYCMNKFFDHLLREQRRISFILGENFEMLPLTREEQAKLDASTI